MSKETYLLKAPDHVAVCVWSNNIQTDERTAIVMCSYLYDEHRNLVPAPYIEIELFHGKARAVPVLYVDVFQKLAREDVSARQEQLDFTVYSWLTMLQRLNFRFEYPQGDGRESDFPPNAPGF